MLSGRQRLILLCILIVAVFVVVTVFPRSPTLFIILTILGTLIAVIIYPELSQRKSSGESITSSLSELLNHIRNTRESFPNFKLSFAERRIFKSPAFSPCDVKLMRAGAMDADWKSCSIEIMPTYAAIITRTLVGTDTLTFNANNLRWLGRVQEVDTEVSEVWLDVDAEGIWYTLQVQMAEPDVKNFVAAIEALRPESIQLRRHRARPNIRLAPVKAQPVKTNGVSSEGTDNAFELYLTPLYLVIMVNGFVHRAISIELIQHVSITQGDGLPDDRDILSFETHDKNFAFALSDSVLMMNYREILSQSLS